MIVSLLDFMIEFIHIKRFEEPVSKEVEDLYSKYTYNRYIKKERQSFWFSSIKGIGRFILFVLFVFFGVFLSFNAYLSEYVKISSLQHSLLIGSFFVFVFLFDMIIDSIEEFVVKKKRVSKKNIKKFIMNLIKRFGLMFGIGGVVILINIILYQWLDFMFFPILLLVIESMVIIFSLFFTKIVVPLFYRLKPLEDGELKEQIDIFLRQEGYQIENVYVLDQDKKSSDMNAFVSGVSSRKRIVLFDTLIKRLSSDEIIAVIAHELGHQKKQHILINMGLSFVLVSGFIFFLNLIVSVDFFSTSFGFENSNLGFSIILYIYLLDIFLLLARTGLSYNSRKFEYQADQYAASVWYKTSLKNALTKIATRNIEHLTPYPLYAKIYYTHPSLVERLKQLSEEEYYE
jgi:STE24 endopeptidase